MTIPLKIYKDACGSAQYSSRNYNDLRDSHGEFPSTAQESKFRLSLRQFSESPPPLHSRRGRPALNISRARSVMTTPDWFNKEPLYTDTIYGNVASIDHLVMSPVRFIPPSSLKWEIGLRCASRKRKCQPFRTSRMRSVEPRSPRVERRKWESSLRGNIRNDEALIELIGKRMLHFKKSHDSIVNSDPKLWYLYSTR